MSARIFADLIITRSRDMWALQETRPRHEIRAALQDIVIDVAKRVADRYCTLADQQNRVIFARGGKTLRDMRTLWRATIKNVKKIYPEHPIQEKHLYVVIAAYWSEHAKTYPKLLSHGLTGQQCYRLFTSRGGERHAIREVLGEGYGQTSA